MPVPRKTTVVVTKGTQGAAGAGTALGGDVDGPYGSNTVRKILNATIPALAGNVGKALVLASIGAFAFQAVQGPITWANDLAGSNDSSQNVVALTGSAGSVLVRGTAVLTFGSNAAAGGDTRFRNATQVASARTAANTADLGLIRTTSANVVLYGAHDDLGSSNASAAALCASTGIFLVTAGVTQVQVDASALTVTPGKVVFSGGPTIDYGTGVPITTPANGSIRIRTDGTGGSDGIYTRQGGAWFAIGGGVPGGSNTQVQFNNSGSFGGAANVTYAGGLLNVAAGLTVGSGTFASAGDIRTAINTTIIATRNNANSGNLIVLSTTTGDAVKLGGALVTITPGILEIGTGVSAATGALRVGPSFSAAFRNAGNTADRLFMGIDGADHPYFGDGGGAGLTTAMLGTVLLFTDQAAGLGRAQIDSTGLTIIGTGVLTFGTNAASTADIRARNGTQIISSRNAANSGNLGVLRTSNLNTILLGAHDDFGTSDATTTYLCATTTVTAVINGTSQHSIGVNGTVITPNLAVGTLSASFNSGTGVFYIADGTAPSTVPSTGAFLFSSSGRLGIWCSNDPAGAPVPVHMILDSVRDVTGSSHDADLKVIVDLPTLPGVTRYIQLFA